MTKKKLLLAAVVHAIFLLGVGALFVARDTDPGRQRHSEYSDRGTPCALKGSLTVSESHTKDLLNGQIGLRDTLGRCRVRTDLSDFKFETDGVIAVSREGDKFFLTADISSHSRGDKMLNILTIRHDNGKSSRLTVVTQNGSSY